MIPMQKHCEKNLMHFRFCFIFQSNGFVSNNLNELTANFSLCSDAEKTKKIVTFS